MTAVSSLFVSRYRRLRTEEIPTNRIAAESTTRFGDEGLLKKDGSRVSPRFLDRGKRGRASQNACTRPQRMLGRTRVQKRKKKEMSVKALKIGKLVAQAGLPPR